MLKGNKKIRVLIVDDSSFMRMAIKNVLSADPEIEIVGTANDGAEGVAQAVILRPDLITMDVEMPRMDGIMAVQQIMAASPTRILMVSTLTCEGATATFDALEAGAIDYVPKNITNAPGAQEQFRAELFRKVKIAARSSALRKSSPSPASAVIPATRRMRSALSSRRVGYIGIGASTGGPTAVQEVLMRLPADFPHAVVVVIHMPKGFTGPYAERLNSKCPMRVKEAANGDLLMPGLVLVAPGGAHTTLRRQPAGIAVELSPPGDHPDNYYVPSVDLMLTSLAEATNGCALGVILTGMGKDGLKGMQHLKNRGGVTVVQDEATSTVYGMPRACIEEKIADEVLPLGHIGSAIMEIVTG